jgi:hypothetical protein
VKIWPTPQITTEYPTTQISMVATTRRMLAMNDCMLLSSSALYFM